MNCPICNHAIPDAAIVSAAARITGSMPPKSGRSKAEIARENGAKSKGRPRGLKPWMCLTQDDINKMPKNIWESYRDGWCICNANSPATCSCGAFRYPA